MLGYLPTMFKAAEIASDLFITVNTVKTHQQSIYRKLGVDHPPGRRRPGPRPAPALTTRRPACRPDHVRAPPAAFSGPDETPRRHTRGDATPDRRPGHPDRVVPDRRRRHKDRKVSGPPPTVTAHTKEF